LGKRRPELVTDRCAQRRAGGKDRVRIDVAPDVAGDIPFARHGEGLGDEGRIELPIPYDGGERRDQALVLTLRLTAAQRRHVVDQQVGGNGLHGLPAIEWIAVMRCQEPDVLGRDVGAELDRRREATVERRYRPFGDADELDGLDRPGERQYAVGKRATVSG